MVPRAGMARTTTAQPFLPPPPPPACGLPPRLVELTRLARCPQEVLPYWPPPRCLGTLPMTLLVGADVDGQQDAQTGEDTGDVGRPVPVREHQAAAFSGSATPRVECCILTSGWSFRRRPMIRVVQASVSSA